MAIALNPALLELTRSGATAAMLLEGQQRLCALCVESVLKKLDRYMENDTMTPERALLLVAEIAAYRRIVLRQQQEVDAGRGAERRLQENGNG